MAPQAGMKKRRAAAKLVSKIRKKKQHAALLKLVLRDLKKTAMKKKQKPLAVPRNTHHGGNNDKKSPPPTIMTLLDIYPIRQNILSHLSTRDLLQLVGTSRIMREDFRAKEWDINAKLSRFFQNPVAFRSQLGQSNALITGSFPLQFFERVVWPDSTLDIIIQANHSDDMVEFLTKIEGYRHVAEKRGWRRAGAQVQVFVSESKGNNERQRTRRSTVKLLLTRSTPILGALLLPQTSALLNIITWNKGYAICALETFAHRETIPLQNPRGGDQLHEEYGKRGWRMRTWSNLPFGKQKYHPDDVHSDDVHSYHAQRRIGDRDTWVMHLDTAGVKKPAIPDSVIEYSSFKLYLSQIETQEIREDFEETGTHDFRADINAEPIVLPSLRYEYVIPHDYEDHPFWGSFLATIKRNALGQGYFKFCLNKTQDWTNMTADEIMSDIMDLKRHTKNRWEYFDDLVPQQYQAWEKSIGL